MTKICMVVHQYYHRDPRVKRYAEALADCGVQVDIICPREQKNSDAESRQNIRVNTIPLKRSYKGKENYILEYFLGFFLYFIKLSGLYFRNHYQIIHIHNLPDFLVFTALLPKIFGAKIILDIHDLMPELLKSKFHSGDNGILSGLIKIQERFSIWFSDTVITANSNFKNNLLKRNINFRDITVINNIADKNIFNREKFSNNSENGSSFKLIYPGTMAPRYGLEIAVRALPYLKSEIPGIKLILIGPKVDYVDNLINLSRQLKVEDALIFKPTLPIEKVPEEIAKADVGIYTAISDPHMEIATPTKVIEYAVMGKPIIASRLKVLQELFDNSSVMFFEPGNIEEFAGCVVQLYKNPALRKELVKNADQYFVEKYSWENEKNKYFELLDKISG